MDANQQVAQLLEQSGAVLIRHKGHRVYALPNGRRFTRFSTPSDYRGTRNELSDLRRTLSLPPGGTEEQAMGRREAPKRAAVPQNGKPIQTTIAPASQMAAPVAEPEPQHEEPPIPPPPPPTLKERLATAIAKHSEQRESLLAQAGVEESRMNMLKGLEQYADDPAMADVLRAILPVDGPPALPPSPARPDMPQAITSTVQVTRQLVWAATQTFEDNRRFTINDVMALMVNGQYIEGRERLRVRGAIASCMMGLHERGLVLKSEQGIGRQQSEWKKVVPGAQQSTEGVQANV